MSNTFDLVIKTPEKEVLSMKAESLYISTEVGDMMLLPEHAAFSGVVSFSPLHIKNGDHEENYIVQRGLLFFSNVHNKASLLCYRCDKRSEIDYNGLKDYLKFIEEKLSEGNLEGLSEYHYKFLENEKVALVQELEFFKDDKDGGE